MKITIAIFLAGFVHSTILIAAEDHAATSHDAHDMESSSGSLTKAGNDIFGTIQEVVQKLHDDPDTDWEKVDIEALRLHLLDMHDSWCRYYFPKTN